MKQISFNDKCLSLISFKIFSLLVMFSDWINTLGVVVFVITDTFDEDFSDFTSKTPSFLVDVFLVITLRFESVTIQKNRPKNISKLGIFCGKTRKIRDISVKTFDRIIFI